MDIILYCIYVNSVMSVRNAEKDLMNKHIDFFPKHRQFTNRLSIQVSEQLKKCRSIKSIAKDNNMSPPMAAKIINEIDFKTRNLPEVLAIDEFRGNAEGEKFQYLLADPKTIKWLLFFLIQYTITF